MRCSKVERQLAPYVDGLLEPRATEAIETHLAQCETCRAAAEDMRSASDALQSLGAIRAPASFAPRVKAAVRAEAARAFAPTLLGPDARPAFAGAFVVLVVGLILARYVVQPRPYVAPLRSFAVADVTPAAGSVVPARPQAGPAIASHRPTSEPRLAARRRSRGYRYRAGMVSSASAIVGRPPSTDHLAPKDSADAPESVGSDAPDTVIVEESPTGPEVSVAGLGLRVTSDPVHEARLVEEPLDPADKSVAAPVPDKPGGRGLRAAPEITLTAVDTSSSASAESEAVLAGGTPSDADGVFTLEHDVFDDTRLRPPYPDFS